MKRILVLIPVAALFTYCGTPRSTDGSANSTTKAMKHTSVTGTADGSDEVVVTGTQYVPILGKNEAGMRADLEGTWTLQSTPVSIASNTNDITANKTSSTGGTEVRRDSVTTRTADGGTQTTTNVYIVNKDGNQGNKITPPQSSNPNIHIPEKPSLNFYGSNETFSGFTGCNKISGRYTMKGNSISFSNAAASTKMACIGAYDETAFLNTLHRVNSFKATGSQLELMEGNDVLLVFSKK